MGKMGSIVKVAVWRRSYKLIAIVRLNEGAIDVNQPINWIHLLSCGMRDGKIIPPSCLPSIDCKIAQHVFKGVIPFGRNWYYESQQITWLFQDALPAIHLFYGITPSRKPRIQNEPRMENWFSRFLSPLRLPPTARSGTWLSRISSNLPTEWNDQFRHITDQRGGLRGIAVNVLARRVIIVVRVLHILLPFRIAIKSVQIPTSKKDDRLRSSSYHWTRVGKMFYGLYGWSFFFSILCYVPTRKRPTSQCFMSQHGHVGLWCWKFMPKKLILNISKPNYKAHITEVHKALIRLKNLLICFN